MSETNEIQNTPENREEKEKAKEEEAGKVLSSMDNITTVPMSEGDKKITKTDFESQSFDG